MRDELRRWRIEELQAVAEVNFVEWRRPGRGGSHVIFSAPGRREIVSVPAKRPNVTQARLDVMPGWLNIANLFTLLRLALVPFVVRAILHGNHLVALVLCVVAGFTDIFDGAIARGFGLASQTGAYLDPIADKCLLSGIFLAMGCSGIVPWWFVAVVFGRDVYILVGVVAFIGLTKIRKFPPSVWGKASTFVQISTAVLWMARNILNLPVLDALSSAMLWVCAVFTIGSGLHYTMRGIQMLRMH